MGTIHYHNAVLVVSWLLAFVVFFQVYIFLYSVLLYFIGQEIFYFIIINTNTERNIRSRTGWGGKTNLNLLLFFFFFLEGGWGHHFSRVYN